VQGCLLPLSSKEFFESRYLGVQNVDLLKLKNGYARCNFIVMNLF
jgi:hypothetical protein